MKLSSITRVTDGPLTVSVLGDDDRLWASIDLTDLTDLRLYGADDCDRLITAAETAKRMLETGTRPHAYEPGAGGYGSGCARCGRVKGRDVHAAPCPSVSPDGDACTVEEPGHEWHYGPDEGGGVRRMWDDADAAAASGQPATVTGDEPLCASVGCAHPERGHVFGLQPSIPSGGCGTCSCRAWQQPQAAAPETEDAR